MAAPSKTDLRHAAFAARYLVNGGNGTEAAIYCGYSEKSAPSTASEILSDPKVQEVLEKARERVVEKAVITVTRVVEELRDILTADLNDAVDETTGVLKPLKDWPVALRRALAGIDNAEIKEWSAETGKSEVIGQLRKVKLWSKTESARELLKHLPGGYATQKVEHEVTVTDHANRLRAAIARRTAK